MWEIVREDRKGAISIGISLIAIDILRTLFVTFEEFKNLISKLCVSNCIYTKILINNWKAKFCNKKKFIYLIGKCFFKFWKSSARDQSWLILDLGYKGLLPSFTTSMVSYAVTKIENLKCDRNFSLELGLEKRASVRDQTCFFIWWLVFEMWMFCFVTDHRIC